ncbi:MULTISPECIES: response regulator [Aeromonas]|uniref:response regulator n=1 Tax=Aeromonas TaxID=642 RepID=UPI00210A5BBE|nr:MULTISPECIES: response regulator [Aeromonas]MCQ4108462.1 response regulator [Aeromonas sp. JL9]
MKILIVEDQIEKSKEIEQFCRSFFLNVEMIIVCQSLRSGLRALMSSTYDLIFLDMSMPNFDPSSDDPLGGTPESFAGKEFLAQMKLRGEKIPVVIITQYQTFEEGQVDLTSIDSFLKSTYSGFYLGAIYYSSADKEWEVNLERLLNREYLNG